MPQDRAERRLNTPALLEPTEFLCLTMKVPNEPTHLANVWGALYLLANGNSYPNDSQHSAKTLSQFWKNLLLQVNIGTCPPEIIGSAGAEVDDLMIRQDPDNPCLLQTSVDGTDWCTFADISKCAPKGVTQPAPAGTLVPGQCYEADVVLEGNGKWILPVPVTDGYTIEVTGATGGWNDGTAAWWCPDGSQYILGFCNPAGQGHNTGDPSSSAFHGSIVFDVNGTWFGTDTLQTMGSGIGSQNAIFQMNDVDITDNAGSISFHVKVCNPIPDPSIAVGNINNGGSLPSVHFGVPFTVNCSTNPNGHCAIFMGFDRDVTLTLLSSSGWQQPYTSGGDTIYASNTGTPHNDAAHVFAGTIVLVSSGLNIFSNIRTSGVYIGSQIEPFSMTFRIDP